MSSRIALPPSSLEATGLFLGEERIQLRRSQGKRSIPSACPSCRGRVRLDASGYGVCKQCGEEVASS